MKEGGAKKGTVSGEVVSGVWLSHAKGRGLQVHYDVVRRRAGENRELGHLKYQST